MELRDGVKAAADSELTRLCRTLVSDARLSGLGRALWQRQLLPGRSEWSRCLIGQLVCHSHRCKKSLWKEWFTSLLKKLHWVEYKGWGMSVSSPVQAADMMPDRWWAWFLQRGIEHFPFFIVQCYGKSIQTGSSFHAIGTAEAVSLISSRHPNELFRLKYN